MPANDQSMSGTPATECGAGTTRRTVIRTGATAAWAVPAIVLVSAAPAMAASGPAALAVGTWNAQRAGSLAGCTLSPCTITNQNTLATTALQLIIEFEPTNAGDSFGTSTVNTAPTGWGAATVSSYGPSNRFRRFSYNAPPQLTGSGTPATASRSVAMNVTLSPNAAAGTMRITAIPGGAGTQVAPNPRTDTF